MNKGALKEIWETLVFKLTSNIIQPTPGRNKTLILIMTTPWGNPCFEDIDLPNNFELTTNKWRYREATAIVFHIPTFKWIHRIKKQPGQLWVAWSLECDANYPLQRDPKFMQQFDLTMTYHVNSDVPVSYFYYDKNSNLPDLLKTTAQAKVNDNIASLFISSKIDHSGRLKYAAELMKFLDIHSYGKQLNNRTLKNDTGRQSKWNLNASYKFTLAFENAIAPDYVTEKFYDPLIVGSVPIYMGAPNIEQFAPADHCYINVTNFGSPKELAEYILTLNEDETLYQEYLTWKQKPLRKSFLELVESQRKPSFARLCHKIQELKEADSKINIVEATA